MDRKTSKVTRSWKATLTNLGVGVAAGGLSVVLFATLVSGTVTFGIAAIPMVVAFIFLYLAFKGSAVSTCPECANSLDGLAAGANDGVLCRSCLKYLEGTGGELRATDEGRIADQPLFRAKAPQPQVWPEGCCVCGAKATRGEEVHVTIPTKGDISGHAALALGTGGMLISSGGGIRYTVTVPYCDGHKEGALLTGSTPGELFLSFRSLPYLRAFCQANDVKPE